MSRTTMWLLWALALVTLVPFPMTPGAGGRSLIQAAVTAAALAVAWQQLRRRPELARHGWRILVTAVTVLGVSDAIGALELHVVGYAGHPRPSNLLALVGYAMLTVGVVQFERTRGKGRKMPGRMESAIFAFGALTPLLVFLILPVIQAEGMSLASRVTTVTYAVADLAVMTVLARVLVTSGRQNPSLVFLSTALAASLVGDLWSGIATGQGPASQLAPVQMLWLAAFILFAAGVAHPSVAALTQGIAWGEDVSSQRRVWLMGVGQAIPAITLAVAWSLGGSPYDLVIAFSGLTVSVLVSARVTSLLARIHDQSGQLASLARSDELTGLHNRRSWGYELARACNAATERGYDLCVALVDLDNFKIYNDSYGHPAGDALLRECAEKWRKAIGEDDLLARYGGEEFAVVLPGCDLDRAVAVMNELRKATPGGQTVSVGVAAWTHGTDPSDAMSKADAALYRAKRAGRNRVVAADGTELAPLPGPLKYVRTVVQPIVRAKDLEVVGYEALTRFAHDDDVQAVFTEAHESGFGDLLEVTAIQRALAAPGRPEGVDLFVNVSERAMRSRRFWDELPFDLHGVVIELHENRDGLDDETLVGYLDRFRARGARIGLGDLGVRGTDLARIANLCPDIVKLDRSRVEACDRNPAQLALLKEFIDFSLEFGVAVCVEGVETEAELAAVREAGATLVQGFLLGRPQVEWYADDEAVLEEGDEAEVTERVVEHA